VNGATGKKPHSLELFEEGSFLKTRRNNRSALLTSRSRTLDNIQGS
jgi:hypothetical protein